MEVVRDSPSELVLRGQTDAGVEVVQTLRGNPPAEDGVCTLDVEVTWRNVGTRWMVSLGNKIDVDEVDLLAHLIAHDVGRVVLYLESMETPLRTGGEMMEGLLKQVRAKAIASTSSHRVVPTGKTGFVVGVLRAAGLPEDALAPSARANERPTP